MRRSMLAVLMIGALMLSACGSEGVRFTAFRDEAARAAAVSVTAAVGEYTLAAECTAEGCRVTVLAPELIAGVSAQTDADGANIIYDGVVISELDSPLEALTPVGALPAAVNALREGHIDSVWAEGELLAAQLTVCDEYFAELRLDAASMTPVSVRLVDSADGAVVVECAITEFILS